MPIKSVRVHATAGWWRKLTTQQKKAYIRTHPNSKYATTALRKTKVSMPIQAKVPLVRKPRTAAQIKIAQNLNPRDLTSGPLWQGMFNK